MSAPFRFAEREEAAWATPHLSFSRLARYLHCPEQYRLYYLENLRPRAAAASLVFGQAVHQALAQLFRGRGEPVACFEKTWLEAAGYDLDYGARDTWARLQACGQALLEKFLRDEKPRFGGILAVEHAFELRVTSLPLPLVGVIDLVAEVDGERTVVDFKTSAASYEAHEVLLSDQLTAYQLAEPAATLTALCVLVKTKEPRIEWHRAPRDGARLTEFLAKAAYLAHEIDGGRFYRRPGKWCAWCDYLPVCTGDEAQTGSTLVRIEPQPPR